MKLGKLKKYLLASLLLGYCGSGWAVVYDPPSPLPPGLVVGSDIDGTGLFTPGLPLLSFELFDVGEVDPSSPPPELEFGYYFASDAADGSLVAGELNTIFASGNSTNNGPVTVNLGIVAPIGFYALGLGQTVTTQATLNPQGFDFTGVFPIISEPTGQAPDDSYLISFVIPFGNAVGTEFYIAISGPLTPSPIPVPGAIFLWLTGLGGLVLFRRFVGSGSLATATATQ